MDDSRREDTTIAVEDADRHWRLFELSPDPFVVTTTAGVVQEANRAARELLGRSLGSMPGTPLGEFIAPAHRARAAAAVRAVRGGTERERWDLVLEVGGGVVPAEVCLRHDDVTDALWWQLREQRERAMAERNLHAVAESEHREASRARRVAASRSSFLVSLAHDMRAPIGALMHQTQMLASDSLSAELRRRSLSVLEENASDLEHLLDTLVDIERLMLGEIMVHPRPTDLVELLEELAAGQSIEVRRLPADAPPDQFVFVLDDAIVRRALRVATARVETVAGGVSAEVEAGEQMVTVRLRGSRDGRSSGDDGALVPRRLGRDAEFQLAVALVELHGGHVVVDPGADAIVVSFDLPTVTAAHPPLWDTAPSDG